MFLNYALTYLSIMAVGATVKNFIFPFLRELKLWYVSICGLETTKTNKNNKKTATAAVLRKPRFIIWASQKALGAWKLNPQSLNSIVQCLETPLPDDTVTLAQVQKNRSESILIANALFSIPVHTDDQDLFAFCEILFNTPLMSFHKAMTRKFHSQMED